MKYSIHWAALALSAVIAAGLLSACSGQKSAGNSGWGGASSRGSGASQTRVVGKVTSVIGNQVTLTAGTWNSGSSSSGGQSVSSVQPSSSGQTASFGNSEFTPTGGTQTFLIPVGLTLSSGNSGRRESRSSGASSESSGSGSFRRSGSFSGSGTFGGNSGNSGNGQTLTGGSAASSRGGSAGTTAGTLGTVQRSRDFSSVTRGMILRIAETQQSDGTKAITQVQGPFGIKC